MTMRKERVHIYPGPVQARLRAYLSEEANGLLVLGL